VFLLALTQARHEEDLRLLQGIARQDRAALGRFYDLYAPLLFPMLVRLLRAEHEAEDVLQETFVQVWMKASLFVESRGSVYTWVMTICRRRAIDRLRSKGPEAGQTADLSSGMDVADTSPGGDPLLATISAEHAGIVRSALAGLPEEQRVAVELGYLEGFSQSEIAEKLGVPLGTVKSRMRLALMRLRTVIRERLH
jgi:RNA polymerase sigma-70 factor (ECF subfamily)